MKVKELIELLQKEDPEKTIGISCSNCTMEYGYVTQSGIHTDEGLILIEAKGFVDPDTEEDIILIKDKFPGE